MAPTETLGQRLQRLRAAAGLTQAAVAEQAGVPAASLRSWETDRREPGFRPLIRLAKVLGVTVEVLGDTLSVDEAGKTARPAGPTKLAEAPAPPPAKSSKGGKAAVKGKAARAKRKE